MGLTKLTVSEGGRNVTALYPSGHFGRNHAGKEDDEEEVSSKEGSQEENRKEEEVTLAGRSPRAEAKREPRPGCPFFFKRRPEQVISGWGRHWAHRKGTSLS